MNKYKLHAAVVFVSIIVCLVTLIKLTGYRTATNQADWSQRNKSASSFYADIATLSAPLSVSDITFTVHEFVRNTNNVKGATLFDSSGQLMAQIGSGNDALTKRRDSNSATIPIKSSGSHYGHAVLAFEQTDTRLLNIFFYITLAVFSALLAALPCGLLLLHTSNFQTAR
jgi:hypothetical protein